MWLRKYGIFFIGPALTFVALSTVDARFIIVALMVVLLIVPLMMPLWYYYYMLTPEVAAATLPHSVTATADRTVTVTYLPPDDDSDLPTRPSETFCCDKIKKVFRHRGFMVMTLDLPRMQFILIPLKCLKASYANR